MWNPKPSPVSLILHCWKWQNNSVTKSFCESTDQNESQSTCRHTTSHREEPISRHVQPRSGMGQWARKCSPLSEKNQSAHRYSPSQGRANQHTHNSVKEVESTEHGLQCKRRNEEISIWAGFWIAWLLHAEVIVGLSSWNSFSLKTSTKSSDANLSVT